MIGTYGECFARIQEKELGYKHIHCKATAFDKKKSSLQKVYVKVYQANKLRGFTLLKYPSLKKLKALYNIL